MRITRLQSLYYSGFKVYCLKCDWFDHVELFTFDRKIELPPNDKGKPEEWKILLLHNRGKVYIVLSTDWQCPLGISALMA